MDFTQKVGKDGMVLTMHHPRGDVALILTEYGIDIGLEGHNLHSSEDGEMDGIVFLGLDQEADAFPTLFVWGDINLEDPTIRVQLRDSVESNRRDV